MRLIKFINKLWVTNLTFIPKKLTWILIENCCLGKLSFSLETTSSALFLAFVVCVMKANSETGFSFNKMSTFTRLVSYVDKNYGLEFENKLLIYRYIETILPSIISVILSILVSLFGFLPDNRHLRNRMIRIRRW